MKPFFFFSQALLSLLFLCCSDNSGQLCASYRGIFSASEGILLKEDILQSEIDTLMALQTSSPDSISDSLYFLMLDQRISTLWLSHGHMVAAIKEAVDSLDSLEVRLRIKGKSPHKDPVFHASKKLIWAFDQVAGDDYIRLINLITLPDTAYTEEKHNEYILTGEQLNMVLDHAVANFNELMDQYGFIPPAD